MKIDRIAWALVVIGGLNWGLIGLLDYNLVAEIFGEGSGVAQVIYILVGISALYMVFGAARKRA